MVDSMGIVTLFTNLTAAIGFGVFYFTKSTILKEFGLVAGINDVPDEMGGANRSSSIMIRTDRGEDRVAESPSRTRRARREK